MEKELLKENSVRGRFPITKFGNDGLFLQRQTATTGDKGDPRQKPSGMTAFFTTAGGFTLIELLMVVLVIGILAAVAVPQYQKATAKARGATVIPLIRALGQAQEKYFLENGIYADSFAKLDVPLPADWNQSCNFYALSADCHSDGYWGIAIGTETALMGTLYLQALSGPYKRAGFYYMPNRKNLGVSYPAEGFGCLEHFSRTSANSGFWCNKLWGTSFKRGGSSLSFFQ